MFENVPGLFSQSKGRDFATVLSVLMGECGYGVSWRVLDSQFFGLAQRRKRVYIIGYLGTPCPPEVLFEPKVGYRNSEAGEEARADLARTLTKGSGVTGNPPGRRQEDDYNLAVADTLTAQYHKGGASAGKDSLPRNHVVAATPTSRSSPKGHGAAGPRIEDVPNFVIQDVAYALRKDPGGIGQGHNTNYVSAKADPNGVRNSPGVPEGLDDPWPLLPKGLDSPRYQSLGDAVSVPVAEWIGERIIQFGKGEL